MMTELNRLNTGLMAIEASMQLNLSTGLGMVGVLSSKGSMINENPVGKNNLQACDAMADRSYSVHDKSLNFSGEVRPLIFLKAN